MTPVEMDRRALFKLLASLSASSILAPQLWAQESISSRLEGLEEVELDALTDLARAYASFDESDTHGVQQMTERLRGVNLTDVDLAGQIRQEMREDFQSGRLAILHGWHVSRTEARVLAAAAKLLG